MLFFSTHNKSCSGCIFSSLFTPSGSPKSCGGENESTANNRCSGENIFHFHHLGKKLMKELGLPKYQWGALVPPASQVLASICLKGTACVTCQLLRKGTKGTDSCILFWFPSNYVNDKKPQRDHLLHPWYTSLSEMWSGQRFFYDSDCHVALCPPLDVFAYACIFLPWICVCSKHSRMLIIFKLMLRQKEKEISLWTVCAKRTEQPHRL